MPRVHTRKARTDIYATGIQVTDAKTKSGFRKDRSKPADENDKVIIPKGTTYWTWSFQFGPTMRSLTPPKPSQLTRSEFLGQIYDINDELAALTDLDEIEGIISNLEELRDEQEEKRSNMPEGLQDAPTGELLQERYDMLDEMLSELEGIEIPEAEDEDVDDYDEAVLAAVQEVNEISYQGA